MLESSTEIRSIVMQDITAVSQIAAEGMPYAWSEAVFRDCLKADYHGWVIAQSSQPTGRLLGFLIALIQLQDCQVMNIGVSQSVLRCGYGSQLMTHLIDFAKKSELQRITLEVRSSNQAAIQFYQAFDFYEVGLRKRYYPAKQGREDGIVLCRNLK